MMDDEYYNPFDEENISRKRKWFTLVIAFVIASCIAFYIFNTYDVFPQEKEREPYSSPLEWHVIPHTIDVNESINTSIPFDIVIRAYFNSSWREINSSDGNNIKVYGSSNWKPLMEVDKENENRGIESNKGNNEC